MPPFVRCSFLLFVLIGLFVPSARAAAPDTTGADPAARLHGLSPFAADEVLWLARCLYTESDRADEQRFVAWVVRNRVETGYRGRTYREVVLENKQFSAFNAPSPRREAVLSYGPSTKLASWRQALGIALDVYTADPARRPFSTTVRHFYSPVGMPGGAAPHWAVGALPLDNTALGVDPYRFLFFDGIDTPGGASLVDAYRQPVEPTVHTDVAQPSSRRLLPRLRGATPGAARPVRPAVQRPARTRVDGNSAGTGG